MNKVKKYYDNLIDSGSDEFGALARTAKVFSISINQVKRELGRKPKNRVRKPKPQRVQKHSISGDKTMPDTEQLWNKSNACWWFFKLSGAKWISVWPLENRWSILNHQAGGAIQTIEQGVSDSPEKACSESLEKAKTKGYLLPVSGGNE